MLFASTTGRAFCLTGRKGYATASNAVLSAAVPKVKLFIDGEFVESQATEHLEVRNPATQELLSLVPETTPEELKHASMVAQEAFHSWKKTTVLTRQKYMLDLQHAIRQNMVLEIIVSYLSI